MQSLRLFSGLQRKVKLSNVIRCFSKRAPITLHTVTPTLQVPPHIPRPHYAATFLKESPMPDSASSGVQGGNATVIDHSREETCILTDPAEIEDMRKACELSSRVREYAGSLLKIGRTTDEIDKQVHEFIIEHGAYPACLGYGGYPKSILTSINEVVVHGIPDTRPLVDGDIITIDCVVYLNGYFGDCSATYCVGDVDPIGRKLVDVTKRGLYAGINVCAHGVPFKAIGNAISDYVEAEGFKVCANWGGHGVGRSIHLPPFINHGRNGIEGYMQTGMVFTIEPAVLESPSTTHTLEADGWTAMTDTGTRAAQFEECIIITETGYEILSSHGK